MMVENAFLRLPELLISNSTPRDTSEASVASLFAAALNMEVSSRNISMSRAYVWAEKPYPNKLEDGRSKQADLLFDPYESGGIPNGMDAYGVRSKSWIEVKARLGKTRRTRDVSKPRFAGEVIRDLLRLCLLPEELQGSGRQNARYLAVVLDQCPSDSLGVRRANSGTAWLSDLLTEGDRDLRIELPPDPAVRKSLGPGFLQLDESLRMDLDLRTTAFQPDDERARNVFWGYLSRIRCFKTDLSGQVLEYRDVSERWTPEKVKSIGRMQEAFLRRLQKVLL